MAYSDGELRPAPQVEVASEDAQRNFELALAREARQIQETSALRFHAHVALSRLSEWLGRLSDRLLG